MNLRQLTYLVAVAEQRSIQKAALLLHISQPSVSTQIKLLEEELGIMLLERRQDGTVLTPEGEQFLHYARIALDALDAAKIQLRSKSSEEKGHVVVGIPGSLSPIISLQLVRQVQLEYPNIHLKLVSGLSGHLAQWIQDGSIDFGLIHGLPKVNELYCDFILKEQLFLISSTDKQGLRNKTSSGTDIAFSYLNQLPLVLPGKEHGLRRIIEEKAKLHDIRLNVRTELDAHELLVNWIQETDDYSVLSLASLKTNINTENFFIARIVNPVLERRISIAYASNRPFSNASKKVEEIVRHLLQKELRKGWWTSASLNE